MDFSLSPEHKRIQTLSQELAADFETRTAVMIETRGRPAKTMLRCSAQAYSA